jgi:hypothetical protein
MNGTKKGISLWASHDHGASDFNFLYYQDCAALRALGHDGLSEAALVKGLTYCDKLRMFL